MEESSFVYIQMEISFFFYITEMRFFLIMTCRNPVNQYKKSRNEKVIKLAYFLKTCVYSQDLCLSTPLGPSSSFYSLPCSALKLPISLGHPKPCGSVLGEVQQSGQGMLCGTREGEYRYMWVQEW